MWVVILNRLEENNANIIYDDLIYNQALTKIEDKR